MRVVLRLPRMHAAGTSLLTHCTGRFHCMCAYCPPVSHVSEYQSRRREACASAPVTIGGTRFGIMIALAAQRVEAGNTALIISESRICKCQSSGCMMFSSFCLAVISLLCPYLFYTETIIGFIIIRYSELIRLPCSLCNRQVSSLDGHDQCYKIY